MPAVDLDRWALYAEPQSKGKNWCWAAALSLWSAKSMLQAES